MRTVRLAEVAEVKLGRQRSPKNHQGTQMRPYMRAANVGWDGLTLKDIKCMNFTDDEMKTYRLRAGDLLLGEASGSAREVGKPAIWEEQISDCAFQNTLIRIRPSGHADPRYLLHYFKHQASSGSFARSSRGVGIFHLGRKALAEWEIPLPPIEEQRRIAAVLDAADALRAKRRQALAKLDTLTQAIFIDMFGDPRTIPTSPLSNHTEAITKGTTPTSVGYEFTDHGVPFVRVQDLVAGTVVVDRIELHVSPATNSALRRSILKPRDVLVSIAGTIGRVAVVPDGAPPMNCNQAVALIRTAHGLDPVYLQAWMNTEHAQEQMRGSRVTGTISNLSLTNIRRLELPVPTLDEQAEFVDHVDRTRSLALGTLASAGRLDTLFANLQQRAFRGEL